MNENESGICPPAAGRGSARPVMRRLIRGDRVTSPEPVTKALSAMVSMRRRRSAVDQPTADRHQHLAAGKLSQRLMDSPETIGASVASSVWSIVAMNMGSMNAVKVCRDSRRVTDSRGSSLPPAPGTKKPPAVMSGAFSLLLPSPRRLQRAVRVHPRIGRAGRLSSGCIRYTRTVALDRGRAQQQLFRGDIQIGEAFARAAYPVRSAEAE